MKTYHIAEKYDSEGRLYYKALGFLDGKCYRSRIGSMSATLRVMTRNQHAMHPGDWMRTAVSHHADLEREN